MSSQSFCFFFPYFSIGCSLSIFHLPPLHLSSSPDLLKSHLTQSFDLSCSFPFSCILYVFSTFSSTLFTSMSASILTMWPTHFTLLLTNLPVELFCCITYFLRSFILLSSTSLFVLFDKTRTNFQLLLLFCQRHCLQIQIKACLCNTSSQDFPFQLFQNVSVQHDSLYLSPSIRSLLYPASHSTSECSSSLTIPPTYTKPSTWLNSLSSKLMFKSSL